MEHCQTYPTATARSLASVSSEVFTLVLAHLTLTDILNVGRTCKRWHQACGDSAVWRRLFLRHFTVDLHHRPPPLLVVNAFVSAHGARAAHVGHGISPAPDLNVVDWKSLFRLQYCWANGRCSRQTVATGDGHGHLTDANNYTNAPESGLAGCGQASAVSFLAVGDMVFLGRRNGDIFACHTQPTSSDCHPKLTRLDPPAPILGLFHLAHGRHSPTDGQSSIVVALTPRRVHCFSLDPPTLSLSLLSSAKHSLLTVSRPGPIKLLSLPHVRGSFVDESTIALLVAPVLSPSELVAFSADPHSTLSRAPTLSIMDPTTGTLSHVMTGIPAACAFDLHATLNPDRSRLIVLISMSTQLYTPPKSLEQHELRLQTIHFQRSSPSAPNRRWYHTDSQVILPTWTPNSLWPSPLSQQGIPLSPPTHHSPITSIRIAQDLIMSPSGSSSSASTSLALRYIVAAHRDHSLSLYALVPTSTFGPRVYFLGTLPDQVHSAILDVTITASIGRVVALCRDGNARIWQLEPWLPVPGTIVGGVASEAVAPAAIESGPVVDYDVLFYRPSLSYSRKSRFSMLHLRNATPTQTRVPRASGDKEDMPEGHYHQGIAGKWLTVDDQNDGTGQSAWEHKRVRTDALVAEIPVLQGRRVGEHVERAWVHVARDRLVCAVQNEIVCLNFAG